MFARDYPGRKWNVLSRIRFHAFICASICLVYVTPAMPGAFTFDKGKGQVISTANFSKTMRYFDDFGKLTPIDDYRKFELSSYVEYGVTDWLTLIVKPSFAHASTTSPSGQERTFGEMEAGARLRFFKNGAHIVSAQIMSGTSDGLTWGQPLSLTDTPAYGDVRLLYTRDFTFRALPGFIDLQSAYRFKSGADADELHFDVTVGIRPHRNLLVLGQAFTYASYRPERPAWNPEWRQKVQGSLVYDLTPLWSIQGGASMVVAGANTANEQGIFAAVWRRF